MLALLHHASLPASRSRKYFFVTSFEVIELITSKISQGETSNCIVFPFGWIGYKIFKKFSNVVFVSKTVNSNYYC